MTPLFGPKTPPPGLAFGPGYGEHQPGGWRAPADFGWAAPRWQDGRWPSGPWPVAPRAGGWPTAPLDPYGQFAPGKGGFGGSRW